MILKKTGMAYFPHSEADKSESDEIPENMLIKAGAKQVGSGSLRSYEQLKLYFAACRFVSDNSDRFEWNSYKKVDHRIRVALQFFDHDYTIVKKDQVVFKARSIAFKNMKHIEACDYFNQAFDLMAAGIGMEKDEFINAVKQSIGG